MSIMEKPKMKIRNIVRAGRIVRRIEKITGVTGIRGERRLRPISDARCITMVFLHERCKLSMQKTAVMCGVVNHSSVCAAIEKYDNLIGYDKNFSELTYKVNTDKELLRLK